MDTDAFKILLLAPSKTSVQEIFLLAFRAIHGATSSHVKKVISHLGGGDAEVNEDDAEKLLRAAGQLILQATYSGLDVAGIRRLFPPDFHEALSTLICQIVAHHLPEWRETLVSSQVSEPRLLDLDWRVDIKAASNHLSRMLVPTCFVGLQVQNCPSRKNELPAVRNVTFELNREELGTMLEGLVKIRDQLSGVAQ